MTIDDRDPTLERRDEDRRLGFDRRGVLVGLGAYAPEPSPTESDWKTKKFHFRSFEQRRMGVNRRCETRFDPDGPSSADFQHPNHLNDRLQTGPGFIRAPEAGLHSQPALPPTLIAAVNEIIDACRERVKKRQDHAGYSGIAKGPEAQVWEMVDYCAALNQVIDMVIGYHGQDQERIATALHVASQALFADPEVAHEAFISAIRESEWRQRLSGWNDNLNPPH